MSNDPKKDLLYSILAMDSYGRGYGQSLKNLSETGGNASIGGYSIVQNISQSGWLDTGFYAIAYRNSDGKTIISFRGTDKNLASPFGDEGSDFENGYGLGGGNYLAPQANLALRFYQDVVGLDGGGDPFSDNVSVTGHSLGGGLAGYVGKLFGLSGTIFNNMAFEASVNLAYSDAQNSSIAHSYIYGNNDVRAPDATGLSSFATTGEFLHFNRIAQNLEVTDLDSYGGLRSPFALHSAALNVTLQFVRAYSHTAWQTAGHEIIDAFFDSKIGQLYT